MELDWSLEEVSSELSLYTSFGTFADSYLLSILAFCLNRRRDGADEPRSLLANDPHDSEAQPKQQLPRLLPTSKLPQHRPFPRQDWYWVHPSIPRSLIPGATPKPVPPQRGRQIPETPLTRSRSSSSSRSSRKRRSHSSRHVPMDIDLPLDGVSQSDVLLSLAREHPTPAPPLSGGRK